MLDTVQALICAVVQDVGALLAAYTKAGLLGAVQPSPSAFRMLGTGQDALRFRRDVLLFEAAVRIRVGRLGICDGGLKHVVAFGGNNVGKSTVINILAASTVAGVSPEGGHTQHPFAIAANPPPLFESTSRAFGRFKPVSGPLPAGQFDCYGVARVTSPVLPPDVVLWDTPDCDAVGSSRYLDSVVEAVAAADLLLYVTSIERYAVANIVEWVVQLNALGIPIIECLNKTPRRHRQLVMDKQRNEIFPKMAAEAGQPVPEPLVVPLQNLQDGEEEDLWGPDHPEAEQLRAAVLSKVAAADRDVAARAALAYAVAQVDRVLLPARLEMQARETWKHEVTRAVADFVVIYEQHYLQSDTVIEPFKRLNLEILNLIDPNIPGLKPVLSGLRWVTRWPSLLILQIGRQVLALSKETGDPSKQVAPEAKAYSIAHTEVLSALGGLINRVRMDRQYHPFWDAAASVWDERVKELTDDFGARVQQHMEETDRRIKQAAADIVRSLEQRPNLLQALRLAKVSSDAAGAMVGIVIPLHGHIVYDLFEHAVITPLLVAGVESGAQMAIAAYVEQRRSALVEGLRQEAREIAEQLYLRPLLAIGENALRAAGTMGVEDELLTRLPVSLRQLSDALAKVPA